jgi:hypothetical protein
MPKKYSRVKRTDDSLIRALRSHTDLLREYISRVTTELDERFLGEIAGKLRILVYRTRTNKPLLLDLMVDRGFQHTVRIDRPQGLLEKELEIWLEGTACAVTVPGEGLVELTKIDFIRLWSQQSGAAHEDWEHDSRLASVFQSNLIINNVPIHARQLISIARRVLNAADDFLAHIEPPA